MFRGSMAPALASTTRMDIRLKRSLRPIFSKNRIPATMPESKSDLCVRYYIQDGGSGRTRTTGLTLIRGALKPPDLQTKCFIARWWSQSGSNRRPPACKAGAIPAELWPQKGSVPRRFAVELLDAGQLCGRLDRKSTRL